MKNRKTQKDSRLKHSIWLSCVAIILVLVASNLFMLERASRTADNVQSAKEHQLVEQEIRHQFYLHAIDQSQISNWDAALEALEEDIDLKFVQTEIAEWLYADFGLQMSIAVDSENKSRVTVYEETILEPEKGQNAINQNLDLINKARENFKRYLAVQTVPVEIFSGIHDPIRGDNPIYATGIRRLNGQLSTVVAQVMLPDGKYPMPDGIPRVFLTFKPLAQSSLDAIGQKLHLEDFALHLGEVPLSGFTSLKLGEEPVEGAIHAVWKVGKPSLPIWQSAVPVLALAFLMVSAVLFFVGRNFGTTVEQLQLSEKQNRFLALHDALTGLPNRLFFDQELETIIAEKKQDRCAILCMDLDRFKAVNDTFGHQAGDAVLKTIAQRLSARIGQTGVVARIGGDEFIILLKEHLDRDNVLYLCDQIIEEVCIAIDVPGGAAEVGASIGVAWWPDDALTLKSIIRSADEALYNSKENGRGTVSCASFLHKDSHGLATPKSENPIDQLRDEVA